MANTRSVYGSMLCMLFIALAGGRSFLGGGGPFGLGSRSRGLAALAATLFRWRVVFRVSAAGAGFLATAALLVHRGPGPAFGLFFGYATILISFFDMFGLALLLVRIGRFVAAGHRVSPVVEPPLTRLAR
ncbi:membrane hypothetical protein [Agrobacterium genomosp. 2 str. CFBP 5494]|uniref:Transmembrane protein n=1 Tax=Agrobacterium genomosp. 2 str. CFBP 5494 TaxID=1183436 RepID=A0A9W5B5J0_9HYPH|nr:membrane hypothetical protein [Agrobacterium genomosp. 2 str. CFBP 5494]